MKRVPYGESNYKEIIDNNMYFIDKTKYIEILEQMPRYQFFIRPRRFGKSLFLNLLQTYYDLGEKERFSHYFGDKYIGKNKTDTANSYFILRLSFADIVTDLGKDYILSGINAIVYNSIYRCLKTYEPILKADITALNKDNAIEMLNTLRSILAGSHHKLFVLIDEYDNFANGLMIKDKAMYKEIVHTDGYIKSFYKGIKEATAEGAISRVFITGVSPVLLDDLTSGANIFENISNEYALNSMLGVTREELEEIVDHYKLSDYVEKKELLLTMKELYNGYTFNTRHKEPIYNTGMIMYITNKMNRNKRYPDQMLDDNIKTDYGKIRLLAQEFESKGELRSIIEGDNLTAPIEIKSRFGIDQLFDSVEKTNNFFSLLYYLGLLTIKGNDGKKAVLGIPNYSVKMMYWEYLYHSYRIGNLGVMRNVAMAMGRMRKEAEMKDIMAIYKEVRREISNRDLLHYNEMTSKAIFITLLFVDNVYILESEKESGSGYPDLYLKEGITYKEEVRYRYLIEFKHIKEKDYTAKELEATKSEAVRQLERYIDDKRITMENDKPLKKMIIITIGKNELYYEELN